MSLPPAVIVHGLAMARAALAPGLPVTLLSAEGAAIMGGVGWWRALVAAARAGQPAAGFTDILDCGDAPGRALEALRAGQIMLVLRADPRVFADLAQRAAALGAVLLPEAPPALDLGDARASRRLHAWLRTGADGAEPGPR
jgi:hypothetical protein